MKNYSLKSHHLILIIFVTNFLFSQNYEQDFFPEGWFGYFSMTKEHRTRLSEKALMAKYKCGKYVGKSVIISIVDKYNEYVHKDELGRVRTKFVAEGFPDLYWELPYEIRANSTNEIETIIIFDNYLTAVSKYGGRYSRNFSYVVETEVIIVDKATNCLIANKTFQSEQPPESVNKRESRRYWARTGRLPEDEMLRFIVNYVSPSKMNNSISSANKSDSGGCSL